MIPIFHPCFSLHNILTISIGILTVNNFRHTKPDTPRFKSIAKYFVYISQHVLLKKISLTFFLKEVSVIYSPSIAVKYLTVKLFFAHKQLFFSRTQAIIIL